MATPTEMISTFMAERVILGKMTFDELKDPLKAPVAKVLVDMGMDYLVPDEYRHPQD